MKRLKAIGLYFGLVWSLSAPLTGFAEMGAPEFLQESPQGDAPSFPLPTEAQLEAYLGFDPETEFVNPFQSWFRAKCMESATFSRNLLVKLLFSTSQRLTFLDDVKGGLLVRKPLHAEVLGRVRRLDPKASVAFFGAPVRDLLAVVARDLKYGPLPERDLRVEDILKYGSTLQFGIQFSEELSPASRRKAIQSLHREFNAPGLKRGVFKAKLKYGQTPFRWFGFSELAELQGTAKQRGGFPIEAMAMDLETGELTSPMGQDPIALALLGLVEVVPLAAEWSPDILVAEGIQLRLELPFLEFTPASKSYYEQALVDLTLRSKEPQFEKASQGFFQRLDQALLAQEEGGAHNRLHRSKRIVDRLIGQMILGLPSDRPGWLRSLPVFARTQAPAPALLEIPKEFWMDPQEFIDKQTDHGWLYHGTTAGQQVFQSSFPISDEEYGGAAAMGSGLYTTPRLSTALGYAGTQSYVHRFKVKPGVELKILDWGKLSADPRHASTCVRLEKLRESKRLSKFRLLADFYGADIILNEYPLIQNQAVVELDPNPQDGYFAHFDDVLKRGGVSTLKRLLRLGRRLGISKEQLLKRVWKSWFEDSNFLNYFQEAAKDEPGDRRTDPAFLVKVGLDSPSLESAKMAAALFFLLKPTAAVSAGRGESAEYGPEQSGFFGTLSPKDFSTALKSMIRASSASDDRTIRDLLLSNARRICWDPEAKVWLKEQMRNPNLLILGGLQSSLVLSCPADYREALTRAYVQGGSWRLDSDVIARIREGRVRGLYEILDQALRGDALEFASAEAPAVTAANNAIRILREIGVERRVELLHRAYELHGKHSYVELPLPLSIETEDDIGFLVRLTHDLSRDPSVWKPALPLVHQGLRDYLQKFPNKRALWGDWIDSELNSENSVAGAH